MEIATLLFIYNRSGHTKAVLDALSKNSVLPEKLLVFQDGLREGMDDREWKQVNFLIHSIDWCDTEIIVSKYNMGLAKSIVSVINQAFAEYGAVIVLDDDCVPMPSLMHYLLYDLNLYANDGVLC